MSRPLGSKNKPKTKNSNSIRTIQLLKQFENAPKISKSANNWVNWGLTNSYSYDLLNLYNTSVSHRACIDFAVNAICGQGIDYDSLSVSKDALLTPNPTMSWDSFARALAFDFCMYNAFAFQIIKNKDGKTYSFFPQPFDSVRFGEMDDEGRINISYLCCDWTATVKYPPVQIQMFDSNENIPIGERRLFVYKRYNPLNAYYPLPSYSSGINAIQTEAQFQIYDFKNVVNGFTPSGAITLPNVETDEERRKILNEIQRMFTGAENANSVIVTFKNNVDDEPISFTSFAQTNEKVDLYSESNDRTLNRIMAAHKIPSKALVGYPADDTGFSDSGAYMQAAFNLYNTNVAEANRREIEDNINYLFALNGIDVTIEFKPLKYLITEDATEAAAAIDDSNNAKLSKQIGFLTNE